MIEVREGLPGGVDRMLHLTDVFSWLAPSGMEVLPSSQLAEATAWAAG
jgi:hypothetical protein